MLTLQQVLAAFARCGYTETNAQRFKERLYREQYPEKAAVMSYAEWDQQSKKPQISTQQSAALQIFLHDDQLTDHVILRIYDVQHYDGLEEYNEPVYEATYVASSTRPHTYPQLKPQWLITTLDNFTETFEIYRRMGHTFQRRSSLMDFFGNPLMGWLSETHHEVYWEMDEHGRARDKLHLGKMPQQLYDKYQDMLDQHKAQLELEATQTNQVVCWSSRRGHFLKKPDEEYQGGRLTDMLVDSLVKQKLLKRNTEEDEQPRRETIH